MKTKLRKFFYESTRKHSYQEFRDVNELDDLTYPWLYLRFLIITFIVFTAYTLLIGLMSNGWLTEALMCIGSSFGAVFYLILLYEMIKKRDLSLIQLLLISITAGFASIMMVDLLLDYYRSSDDIIRALHAGTIEEFFKGICSIGTILIIKHRFKKQGRELHPITGLLIGVSVALAFTVLENIGYLDYKYDYEIIETGIIRTFDSIVGHLFWTGMISYAFLAFPKAYKNIKFYLVVLLMMAIHVYWDLDGLPFMSDDLFDIIQVVVLGLGYPCVAVFTLVKIIKNHNGDVYDFDDDYSFKYANKARLALFVTLLVTGLITIQFSYLNSETNKLSKEVDKYTYVDTVEHFISEANHGYTLNVDYDRPYDYDMGSDTYAYNKGKLAYAYQTIEIDGIKYEYYYSSNDEGVLELISISPSIELEDKYIYFYERELINIDNEEEKIRYFEYEEELKEEPVENTDEISVSISTQSSIALWFHYYYYDGDEVFEYDSVWQKTPLFYVMVSITVLTALTGTIISSVYNKKSKTLD